MKFGATFVEIYSHDYLEWDFPSPQAKGSTKIRPICRRRLLCRGQLQANSDELIAFQPSQTKRLLDLYLSEIKLEL